MCFASKKPFEGEFFVPARTDFGDKRVHQWESIPPRAPPQPRLFSNCFFFYCDFPYVVGRIFQEYNPSHMPLGGDVMARHIIVGAMNDRKDMAVTVK